MLNFNKRREKSYKHVGPTNCTYTGTEKPLGKSITKVINRCFRKTDQKRVGVHSLERRRNMAKGYGIYT